MSYAVIVILNNDVQYIDIFEFKVEAEVKAIQLANEYYNQDGVQTFAPNAIKTIEQMKKYYLSEDYFSSGDSVHIVIKDVGIYI